jgi:hypothetical protein
MQSQAARYESPLKLAILLSQWAEQREKGSQMYDRDTALARHLADEAMALDAQRLENATPLVLARWKVSWLGLEQRASWLLTARPSRRRRVSRRQAAWTPGLLMRGRGRDARGPRP